MYFEEIYFSGKDWKAKDNKLLLFFFKLVDFTCDCDEKLNFV